MAHEKEKAQYDKDRNDYERPWELWEYRPKFGGHCWSSLFKPPGWDPDYEYRRIEPVFEPEYFSGLNWREALEKGLVRREVEFSVNGDGWSQGKLNKIIKRVLQPYRYKKFNGSCYTYIRTTPETFKHPTITIAGGWKLPRPEVEAPEEGDIYYHVDSRNIVWQKIWENNTIDNGYLNASRIHLTEPRAQEWAKWWDETVIKAVRG